MAQHGIHDLDHVPGVDFGQTTIQFLQEQSAQAFSLDDDPFANNEENRDEQAAKEIKQEADNSNSSSSSSVGIKTESSGSNQQSIASGPDPNAVNIPLSVTVQSLSSKSPVASINLPVPIEEGKPDAGTIEMLQTYVFSFSKKYRMVLDFEVPESEPEEVFGFIDLKVRLSSFTDDDPPKREENVKGLSCHVETLIEQESPDPEYPDLKTYLHLNDFEHCPVKITQGRLSIVTRIWPCLWSGNKRRTRQEDYENIEYTFTLRTHDQNASSNDNNASSTPDSHPLVPGDMAGKPRNRLYSNKTANVCIVPKSSYYKWKQKKAKAAIKSKVKGGKPLTAKQTLLGKAQNKGKAAKAARTKKNKAKMEEDEEDMMMDEMAPNSPPASKPRQNTRSATGALQAQQASRAAAISSHSSSSSGNGFGHSHRSSSRMAVKKEAAAAAAAQNNNNSNSSSSVQSPISSLETLGEAARLSPRLANNTQSPRTSPRQDGLNTMQVGVGGGVSMGQGGTPTLAIPMSGLTPTQLMARSSIPMTMASPSQFLQGTPTMTQSQSQLVSASPTQSASAPGALALLHSVLANVNLQLNQQGQGGNSSATISPEMLNQAVLNTVFQQIGLNGLTELMKRSADAGNAQQQLQQSGATPTSADSVVPMPISIGMIQPMQQVVIPVSPGQYFAVQSSPSNPPPAFAMPAARAPGFRGGSLQSQSDNSGATAPSPSMTLESGSSDSTSSFSPSPRLSPVREPTSPRDLATLSVQQQQAQAAVLASSALQAGSNSSSLNGNPLTTTLGLTGFSPLISPRSPATPQMQLQPPGTPPTFAATGTELKSPRTISTLQLSRSSPFGLPMTTATGSPNIGAMPQPRFSLPQSQAGNASNQSPATTAASRKRKFSGDEAQLPPVASTVQKRQGQAGQAAPNGGEPPNKQPRLS